MPSTCVLTELCFSWHEAARQDTAIPLTIITTTRVICLALDHFLTFTHYLTGSPMDWATWK